MPTLSDRIARQSVSRVTQWRIGCWLAIEHASHIGNESVTESEERESV